MERGVDIVKMEAGKKYGKPTKKLVNSDIKRAVREELREVVSKNAEGFEQLKWILTPNQLKGEIKSTIVRTTQDWWRDKNKEFDNIINFKIKEANDELKNKLIPLVRRTIQEELMEVDLTTKIKEQLEELSEDKFEPSIREAIKATSEVMNERVQKLLKRIVELKTSTQQDILDMTRNDYPETEEMVLKKMKKDKEEDQEEDEEEVIAVEEEQEVEVG